LFTGVQKCDRDSSKFVTTLEYAAEIEDWRGGTELDSEMRMVSAVK
jgi:hypothetical protein